MARVINCLQEKMRLSKEYEKAQNMMSQETRAKLRVPRAITQKRLDEFQQSYDFILSKYASNSSEDVAARAAAKETLGLATQSMEAKQRSIALSLEKSDKLIESVSNAMSSGATLIDAANSPFFSIPGLRHAFGDKIALSVEDAVRSNKNFLESMYQRAFGALSDESKFHLNKQDRRMSKAIAKDYFNAAYGRRRDAPKEIQEIVDALLEGDKTVVSLLKSKGVFIPDKGVEAYLGGLNTVGERLALVTRDQYIEDMMRLESSIDWSRIKKVVPNLVSAEDKKELFGYLYDMEVKGNVTNMPPLLQFVGRRMQKSREHMRLIQFNNHEGWMAYQEKYGDPMFGNILNNYVERTSKLLGVLDTLGPNPSEVMNRVLNYVSPKLNKQDATKFRSQVTDGMQYWLRGFQDPLTPNKRAVVNSVLNLNRSTMLGMHSVGALVVEAPIVAPKANSFAGLPITKYASDWFKQISGLGNAKLEREALIKAGYFLEELMYDVRSGYNSVAMSRGEKVTGLLAKGVEIASLNKMISHATRNATSNNFANSLADFVRSGGKDPHLNRVLGSLIFPSPNEKSFGRYLNSFGITPEDLKILNNYVENFGTPNSPLHRVNLTKLYQADDKALNELAVKVQAAAHNLISSASPESSTYAAARARKFAEGGSLASLVAAFGMQFAGYTNGFFARHINLLKYSPRATAVKSLGALALLTTAGSMAELQIRNLLAGKEPEDITPGLTLRSFIRGGTAGRVGDWIFSAGTNPNSGIMDNLFTSSSMLSNATKLTIGNAIKAMEGKNTSFGYDVINLLKGATPGQNLGWTKLLLEREIFDQLKMAADPDRFIKNSRRSQSELRKKGSDYLWYPGETTPR